MRLSIRRMLCLMAVLIILPFAANGEYSSLESGDQGSGVKRLQNRLAYLGLFFEEADGIYGSKTLASVTEAQRLLRELGGYALDVSGQADELTLSLLYSEEEKIENILMSLCFGSSGKRVRDLQNRLMELKLLDGTADGDYGTETKNAVEKFQQLALELEITTDPVTGIADPYTLSLVNTDLSQYGFKAPIYFDESLPLSLCEEYLYSKACILIDAPSGEVLFESNAHQTMYPASTTKVLTLLTSLEYGNLDQSCVVPQSASEVPADSSLVPVHPGEKMRKIDLLYGLMLRSGNDAANAIATIDAGDIDSFVQKMNDKAAQLGMRQSHFVNPHGYHDPQHYTTAYDLALAARAGLTDPQFCQIVTCLKYTLPKTQNRDALTIYNTYEIFDSESPYFIPCAAGVKSGYTSHAGFCFVGAAQDSSRTLIAVILDAPTRNAAWTDLWRLYAYGFALED